MEDAPQPPSRPAPGSPLNHRVAGTILSDYGHPSYLGLRYHDLGDHWIELALPWREDLVGLPETGVLASGPIISLLDSATSLAVNVRSGALRPVATLDLRIDYMRAARPGVTVIARGDCYRITRSVAFVRGLAHEGDPDDPVAHAAASFMLMDAS
jgi:uncharacterized protein (TIGR00369 family)